MNNEKLRTAICVSDWDKLKEKNITAINYTGKVARSLCSCGFYTSRNVSICPDCGNTNFTNWAYNSVIYGETILFNHKTTDSSTKPNPHYNSIHFFTKNISLVENGKTLEVRTNESDVAIFCLNTFLVKNSNLLRDYGDRSDNGNNEKIIKLFLSLDAFPQIALLKKRFNELGLELNFGLFLEYGKTHRVSPGSLFQTFPNVMEHDYRELINSEPNKVAALMLTTFDESKGKTCRADFREFVKSDLVWEICKLNINVLIELFRSKLCWPYSYHLSDFGSLNELNSKYANILIEECVIGNLSLSNAIEISDCLVKIANYKNLISTKNLREIIKTYLKVECISTCTSILNKVAVYKEQNNIGLDSNLKIDDILAIVALTVGVGRLKKPESELKKVMDSFMIDPLVAISNLAKSKDVQ